MVLLAPAMMEDQKFMICVFAGQAWSQLVRADRPRDGKHTGILSHPDLALVVDGKPHGPRRQVAENDGPQPPIHTPDALLAPDDFGGAHQPIVHLRVPHVPAVIDELVGPLSLQLGLDDVQRTCDDAGGEAANGTGNGVELGVGGADRPSLQRGQGPRLVHWGRVGGESSVRGCCIIWRRGYPAWLGGFVERHPLLRAPGLVFGSKDIDGRRLVSGVAGTGRCTACVQASPFLRPPQSLGTGDRLRRCYWNGFVRALEQRCVGAVFALPGISPQHPMPGERTGLADTAGNGTLPRRSHRSRLANATGH